MNELSSNARVEEKSTIGIPFGDYGMPSDVLYSDTELNESVQSIDSFRSFLVINDIDIKKEISKPSVNINYFKQLSMSFYDKGKQNRNPLSLSTSYTARRATDTKTIIRASLNQMARTPSPSYFDQAPSAKNSLKLKNLINNMQKSTPRLLQNSSRPLTDSKSMLNILESESPPPTDENHTKISKKLTLNINKKKENIAKPAGVKLGNTVKLISSKIYLDTVAKQSLKSPNSSKTTQAQSNNTSHIESAKPDIGQKAPKLNTSAAAKSVFKYEPQQPSSVRHFLRHRDLKVSPKANISPSIADFIKSTKAECEPPRDSYSSLNSKTPIEGKVAGIVCPSFKSANDTKITDLNQSRLSPKNKKIVKKGLQIADFIKPAEKTKGAKRIEAKRAKYDPQESLTILSHSRSKESHEVSLSYKDLSKVPAAYDRVHISATSGSRPRTVSPCDNKENRLKISLYTKSNAIFIRESLAEFLQKSSNKRKDSPLKSDMRKDTRSTSPAKIAEPTFKLKKKLNLKLPPDNSSRSTNATNQTIGGTPKINRATIVLARPMTPQSIGTPNFFLASKK